MQLLLLVSISSAQVGINTTSPKARLDISSSNQALPSNKDGLLIPKIDAFPLINPTSAQQGMLVYLTTDVGANVSGFYYWNNTNLTWLPVKGADGGTLNQSYNFGGAGLGKTITADNGAVTINGTDGFIATGTLGSGESAPSGSGTRMVWNPKKAAFRAGNVGGSQWDDANIGSRSMAFGFNTSASGNYSAAFGFSSDASGGSSTAFGEGNTASGNNSTAFGAATKATGNLTTSFGYFTTASGSTSTAFGYYTTSSGIYSTAFGSSTTASGRYSTAFGQSNSASSYGETVLGIGATTYTSSINGDTQFRTANATDRLFVIGNAIDSNNSGFLDPAERSDAMVVLKNGNTGFGTSTPTQNLEISGPAGLTTIRIANTSTGGSSSNVSLDFLRQGNANTDWRIYNIGPNLTIGNSSDDFATVNDLYQFQGSRFTPINDNAQNLGQTSARWNTLFATNGTINTSDAREKKNIQNLNYGLNDLMKLRPVRFEWKKDDGSGTKLGLIAQELQQIIPEVVRDWDWEEDQQGNRKKVKAPILGVFYSDLIPVLIHSIQELSAENTILKSDYQALVKRLESLEEKIK